MLLPGQPLLCGFVELLCQVAEVSNDAHFLNDHCSKTTAGRVQHPSCFVSIR